MQLACTIFVKEPMHSTHTHTQYIYIYICTYIENYVCYEKLREVILSIVEGDCERWALLPTRKTGFGAYWHHCQSLDRLGMSGVRREQLFLALLLPHSGTSKGVFSKGGNLSVLQMLYICMYICIHIQP